MLQKYNLITYNKCHYLRKMNDYCRQNCVRLPIFIEELEYSV